MVDKRLGILVGGGPAPGINSALSAAAIEAIKAGLDVTGIYDGFQHLIQGRTDMNCPLRLIDVSRIHSQGGSIIRTSRANPTRSEADLRRTAETIRALGITHEWEAFDDFVKHFHWDTTVYSREAMELLIKVVGVDNVIYASEMLGGVNATDPATGRSFDDNKPLVDAVPWLTALDRKKIFEENVRTVYPRLVANRSVRL